MIEQPTEVSGRTFAAAEQSNPLGCKIRAFNTVSPDVDASIAFYRDLIGMTLIDDRTLEADISSAPGVGAPGRRQALLKMEGAPQSALVRVLAAPANAAPNRPRPHSGPQDPGLLAMEGRAQDPAVSYHRLASAGVPMISPPRYYFFRSPMRPAGIDVMTYSPFGPGGEQLFLTARVLSGRHDWPYPGIHSGFHNAAVTSLDQRPLDQFYEDALGLKRTSQLECAQENANELLGAPPDAYFLWGNVGAGVSIEVWEVAAEKGVAYPTALDRTGLAMLTIAVSDLTACRAMCDAAGVAMVGEGALPLEDGRLPEGFVLRGAAGELIEVIAA